ncbi:MAG: electron transfer flavoprotein subunit beta/FixA family protein [Chloroflexi bacterium]|nr:electron transfer flavoprotein subunit beta/FixA family protein [Chloroflexota bacterium]
MRIVVCLKQVLDPDAVNAYALWGRLKVDPATKALVREGVPLLINAYDEQALEAALRIRDKGVPCTITALTLGDESSRQVFRHAFAMGADEGVLLMDPAYQGSDGLGVAHVLAGAIRKLGGADLVLCGRQASDDDQGVVGLALAELLDMPAVTIAGDVQVVDGRVVRVVRALPDGEEVVEADLPALVTISSELGQPRFPSARGMLEARRKQPRVWSAQDIGVNLAAAQASATRVRQVDLFVPQVQGQCQFIQGEGVAQKAAALAQALRQEGLI